MASRLRITLLCVASATALLTAGCGGDDKGPTEPAAQGPSGAPSPSASATDPVGKDVGKGGAAVPTPTTSLPISQRRLYLHPPAVGKPGAICGTAQNAASAEYALKVVRGQVKCSYARTVFSTYFGYLRAREQLGYGYAGQAVKVKGGWVCSPAVKGDVTGRSINCLKSGAVVNASVLVG